MALVSATGRRAVRRIALARTISVAGGTAAYTALTFALYDRTGSAAWVSAGLLATVAVSSLLMPLGGLLADRYDRRRVMIAADVAAAAGFAALSLADAPWALVALAVVATACELPILPASSAAIPNLAGEDDLPWANGLVSGGLALGVTVGPLVGGLGIALGGPSWVFAFNAATFLASAAIVWSVRTGRFNEPARAAERAGRALLAGLQRVRASRVLRLILLSEVVGFAGFGVVMTADAPLAADLGAGAVGYGAMIAFWGGGMLVGAHLAGRRTTAATEPTGLLAGTVVMAVGIALIAVAPGLVPVVALNAVGGIGAGIVHVTRQSIVQRRTADVERSRVFAVLEAVATVTFTISLAGAGLLIGALGPAPVYGLAGLALLLGAGALVPLVRRPLAAAAG